MHLLQYNTSFTTASSFSCAQAGRSRWSVKSRGTAEPLAALRETLAEACAVRGRAAVLGALHGRLSVLQKAEAEASRPVELPAETIDTVGVYKRKVKCDSKQVGSFFN